MNKRMINLIHELMKKECTVGELADQFLLQSQLLYIKETYSEH